MAVSIRARSRKGSLQFALIAATAVAGVAAVLPILFAVIGGVSSTGGAKTAFASEPPGQYAVVSRTEGTEDIIGIAPLAHPADAREVARITHLDGFAANGAVSPDGKLLALVAPDAGTATHPSGSLLVVALETGAESPLLTGIDPQQTPVWANDSTSVVVTAPTGASAGQPGVRFVKVPAAGGTPETVYEPGNVLGAYAVGFDPAGRFVSVIIDGRGSTAVRNGTELLNLSSQITRDWRLSPDGKQLAFIEANLVGGLHYVPRVLNLDGDGAHVEAQAAGDTGQALGTAWQPGAAAPTFGREGDAAASTSGDASARAQVADSSAPGFDVPLGYSADGRGLVVNHWSGSSFASPGKVVLEVVADGSRTPLDAYGKFLGWAQR